METFGQPWMPHLSGVLFFSPTRGGREWQAVGNKVTPRGDRTTGTLLDILYFSFRYQFRLSQLIPEEAFADNTSSIHRYLDLTKEKLG